VSRGRRNMPIRGPKYVVTPGDWQQVQIDLNDLWDSLTAAINVSTGGIVTNHNDLSGLQGGTTGQYKSDPNNEPTGMVPFVE